MSKIQNRFMHSYGNVRSGNTGIGDYLLGKLNLFFSCLIVVVSFSLQASDKMVVTVAIIDTGIDLQHATLKDSLWQNSGEMGIDEAGRSRATNELDDDKNGWVDDVYGWDFSRSNKDVNDQQGHGTHIAGLIKNELERLGSSKTVRFMSLKYYQPHMTFKEEQEAFLQALNYAIEKQADIINISAGGYSYSQKEYELLQIATAKNILVVAAAGNKKAEHKYSNFYPAAYPLENVISVVATDAEGKPLATSNINPTKKNEFAIGKNLYSSLPNNKFGYLTGSSQATAVVTAKIIANK